MFTEGKSVEERECKWGLLKKVRDDREALPWETIGDEEFSSALLSRVEYITMSQRV